MFGSSAIADTDFDIPKDIVELEKKSTAQEDASNAGQILLGFSKDKILKF